MKETGIQSGVIVLPSRNLDVPNLEAFVWDELSNVIFL